MRLELGKRIKDLRLAAELTQEELANRAKLTKGFISQIENDQTSISLDSLIDILDALGLSIGEFFAEDDDSERITFTKTDRISLTGRGARSFELLIPGSTNMLMDPILVTLDPGEALPVEEPHNGEEFGYLLSGHMVIKYGKKSFRLKKDDCFYFEADKTHQFVNMGKSKATFVWVMAPPQM
jgi:transcriptional regulator with XRE-family HTH domain